jgi:hypothetical protein
MVSFLFYVHVYEQLSLVFQQMILTTIFRLYRFVDIFYNRDLEVCFQLLVNSNLLLQFCSVGNAEYWSSTDHFLVVFQSRFAEALLKELAGIDFPSERIYGLGTGLVGHLFSVPSHIKDYVTESVISFFSPKVEVLQQLQQMPQHQGLKLQ